MNLKRLINIIKFYKNNLVPSFGFGTRPIIIFKNYFCNKLESEYADETHLKSAIDWLDRAQKVNNSRGVPATYSVGPGWGISYPETTGYIISTFITYSKLNKNNYYIDLAKKFGDWEIEIQTTAGGVLSSSGNLGVLRIFNTGQVILGWINLYEETREEKYLNAAMKAGDWLVNEQEFDGQWIKNTFCGSRTYHARVDWSLLRLSKVSGDNKYTNAAIKNLTWVLKQQKDNGFFENCGFDADDPITHTIIYTVRGLLESHCSNLNGVKELDIIPKVSKVADILCDFALNKPAKGIKGMIPTSFNSDWQTKDDNSCLTGNAQCACFLYRLAYITKKEKYAIAADQIVSALKKIQLVNCPIEQIRGAIPGTYPFYSGYMAGRYPNWAAKFFADAIILKNNYKEGLVIKA